ncbi:MAG: hypothetical protein FHK79_19675 [Pseudomonas sp.]|nr:MAG: hypothetical protein FHK79_19675 [Pseudomonas sp.]
MAVAPKGTKKSCPCIRVSLRSTSLVPSSLRGWRTRAIHGPLRLSRHPCRSLPCATIPLGLLKGANGIA